MVPGDTVRGGVMMEAEDTVGKQMPEAVGRFIWGGDDRSAVNGAGKRGADERVVGVIGKNHLRKRRTRAIVTRAERRMMRRRVFLKLDFMGGASFWGLLYGVFR